MGVPRRGHRGATLAKFYTTNRFLQEFVGIPPEEDAEVPGTYFDALNPQTKLGKAVRAAVDELNHLNALEMETLQQADALLKKLGLKTSILQGAPAQPAAEEEEEQQQE
ncbi:hypothetical protein GPECTOR_10g1118 [Gonium pectorale]|uniref:Uncharacterized protein n=1 Tax=Gonium pectorale TaxID=33097 RepID=A0A150GQJ4_GONPE|nr:hypothetical protein GPECTOR_10g1118 [Gonium pectorale]|eukprot:KXZ52095.1 hypothetical protein GPECTOR_10g1118 [Gonium pectorale]